MISSPEELDGERPPLRCLQRDGELCLLCRALAERGEPLPRAEWCLRLPMILEWEAKQKAKNG